jgi:hypothetical protein
MQYEGTTDSTLFEFWFEKCLLPCLFDNTVIVMDNAAFHRKNKLSLYILLLHEGFSIVQQIFIIYSCYNSLIVAVIGMFLIRFAGAYTAATAETVSNTTIIASKTIGRLHWLPKYRVTSFTYKKRLKTIPMPLPTIRPEPA